MSKVNIEQLENIVLEGGGAKGAAYAGAIRGIEKALCNKLDNSAINPESEGVAILDFGKVIADKFEPQVKLFGGSSAGAITSMALALGFSADEIEKISEFEFSKFLRDADPGKYRMIAKDGSLKIGEDKKSLLGQGDGTSPYNFLLEVPQNIKPSWLKAQIHGIIIGQIRDILVRGVVEKLPNLKAIWQKLTNGGGGNGSFDLENYISIPGSYAWQLKFMVNGILDGKAAIPNSPFQFLQTSPGTPIDPAVKAAIVKGLNEFIDYKILRLSIDAGMKFDFGSLANVIWDRGLFSGFAVREFFFDMMLYACVNNTHFHRCYFQNEDDRKALRKVKMTMKDGRLKADLSPLNAGIRARLKEMGTMTFKEFHAITGVSLLICVSNFSTDEPSYFSHYWTPDFPVLEAVGASMSIPPAIRPVYNESDVIKDPFATELYAMDGPSKRAKKKGEAEYFNFDEYHLDAVAIKAFLAEHFGANIDVNNNIGFAGHLNFLRKLLVEIEDSPGYVVYQNVNSQARRLTRSHFVYHYNAAYKGLFLDGGYRNNIPYNALRAEMYDGNCETTMIDPDLDKTFAIKLDETFPKEWVSTVYRKLEATHKKMGSPKLLEKEQRKVLGQVLHANLRVLLTNSDKRAQKVLDSMEDLKGMNKDSFERVAQAVVKLYADMTEKHRQPWNKKKAIIATAFEGYSYGSDAGQIRHLSDHDKILPLYSFGIGTFDFNLEKIAPLVELSKRKSEERVLEYFGIVE